VKSINDFTNSLAKALVDAEGTPSKELKTLKGTAIKRSELQLAQELTRELLADGLRRALDMLGEMSKKQFLDRQFGRVFEGSSETVGRTTSIRGQDSHFASFLHRLGRACWVGLTLQERLQS